MRENKEEVVVAVTGMRELDRAAVYQDTHQLGGGSPSLRTLVNKPDSLLTATKSAVNLSRQIGRASCRERV